MAIAVAAAVLIGPARADEPTPDTEGGRYVFSKQANGVLRLDTRSGAASLLAAGQKGLRFALPNARILVHQPKGGFEGQATDNLHEAYWPAAAEDRRALERDFFMTAETAKDFGLVDNLPTKRLSAPG